MAELYIPIERPKCNPVNGRFVKGHVPFNKGKKWDEYMPKKSRRGCRKGWKNLQKYRPTMRPDTSGRCRKQVVSVTDDGKFTVHPYVLAAAEWLARRIGESCNRENVGRCCRMNASGKVCQHSWRPGQKKGSATVNTDHKYKGIRFYFESDIEIWKGKVKRQ